MLLNCHEKRTLSFVVADATCNTSSSYTFIGPCIADAILSKGEDGMFRHSSEHTELKPAPEAMENSHTLILSSLVSVETDNRGRDGISCTNMELT